MQSYLTATASWGDSSSDETPQVPVPAVWTFAAQRNYRYQHAMGPLLLKGLREMWVETWIKLFLLVGLLARCFYSFYPRSVHLDPGVSISLCHTLMLFAQVLKAGRSKPTSFVGQSSFTCSHGAIMSTEKNWKKITGRPAACWHCPAVQTS